MSDVPRRSRGLARLSGRLATAALLAATLVASAPLGAQGAPADSPAPAPGTPRSVAGRIVRPVTGGEQGVGGVMVTLHRVGPDRSGPIDSVRTTGDGAYTFRYRPTGSDEALYFVSALYGGIAYFGTPLRAARVAGEDAVVTVFDTTSAPIPLRINGRHIIVSASDAAEQREVMEVFEITNDTSVTRVAGGRDSATFRVVLPEGATGFSGQQGDVSPEAIALVSGRAEVYAPLAPGIKQISFSYKLPRSAFPLTVPAVDSTEVLEVLLEDATGVAEGALLVKQGPVTSSGRTFVRWLAEGVPANAVVRVSFPSASRRPVIPTFVVVAAGLAAAMLFAMRTIARRRAPADRAPADADPDRLAARIAALDASFDRKRLGARALGREVSDEERGTYEAERARLKAELTDALARREQRG